MEQYLSRDTCERELYSFAMREFRELFLFVKREDGVR